MPLQNRVQADGAIVANATRGTVYGNRGGKIHDVDTRKLHRTKRWASRQWICCRLQFNNRYRPIMGNGYTELFFLDDVTAFAAGHRPCFECRRQDFLAYAKAWQAARGTAQRPRAGDMDKQLHDERLAGNAKRTHKIAWRDVPVGAVVQYGGETLAKHESGALIWSFNGYQMRPNQPQLEDECEALTPPATMEVLRYGYLPSWHESAHAAL